MPREIRVDALAVECGVPVARVMELLHELGQVRIRRVNQHIPEALAQQVRRRVGAAAAPVAAPAMASHEVDLFAQAMSAAGVRPLAGDQKALRGSRPKPAKAVPSVPAPAASAVLPLPATEPSTAAAAESAPAAITPASDVRLQDALARCAALEGQLAEEVARREALDQVRHGELLELAALREAHAAAEGLAQRLAGHAASAPGQRAVVEVLQRRGLIGLDEANIALRGLLAAHLLDGFLPFLVTPDSERLGRTLDERLCLCCCQDGCGLPAGVERVAVPAARCELCGGAEIGPLFRRLSDACLLAGLTRILFVGGRRWASAWLEGRLDRRVTLRAWSGDIPAQAEVVQSDLSWAEFAILWDAQPLGEELAAAVQARLPRATRRVRGSSIGAVLDAAIQEIEALDPASLLGE